MLPSEGRYAISSPRGTEARQFSADPLQDGLYICAIVAERGLAEFGFALSREHGELPDWRAGLRSDSYWIRAESVLLHGNDVEEGLRGCNLLAYEHCIAALLLSGALDEKQMGDLWKEPTHTVMLSKPINSVLRKLFGRFTDPLEMVAGCAADDLPPRHCLPTLVKILAHAELPPDLAVFGAMYAYKMGSAPAASTFLGAVTEDSQFLPQPVREFAERDMVYGKIAVNHYRVANALERYRRLLGIGDLLSMGRMTELVTLGMSGPTYYGKPGRDYERYPLEPSPGIFPRVEFPPQEEMASQELQLSLPDRPDVRERQKFYLIWEAGGGTWPKEIEEEHESQTLQVQQRVPSPQASQISVEKAAVTLESLPPPPQPPDVSELRESVGDELAEQPMEEKEEEGEEEKEETKKRKLREREEEEREEKEAKRRKLEEKYGGEEGQWESQIIGKPMPTPPPPSPPSTPPPTPPPVAAIPPQS